MACLSKSSVSRPITCLQRADRWPAWCSQRLGCPGYLVLVSSYLAQDATLRLDYLDPFRS
jgi:hypothetical protein